MLKKVIFITLLFTVVAQGFSANAMKRRNPDGDGNHGPRKRARVAHVVAPVIAPAQVAWLVVLMAWVVGQQAPAPMEIDS